MVEIVSLALIVIALAVAIYTFHRGHAERDRRFRAVRDQLTELGRVAYKIEERSMQLEGQLAILRREQEANALVVNDISADTLRQPAFEARMNDLNTAIEQIRSLLEGRARIDRRPAKCSRRVS